MAKMIYTVTQDSLAAAVIEMALVPLQAQAEGDEAWSIDREPMGPGWHDSSWMLRRGLDVIEGLPPEAIPPEWQWRWWVAAGAGVSSALVSECADASI